MEDGMRYLVAAWLALATLSATGSAPTQCPGIDPELCDPPPATQPPDRS
jgi:hypothetical protein